MQQNIPGNCDKQVVNDKVLRKTGFPRETMQIYADWSSSQYMNSQPDNQKQMTQKQKLIPTYALDRFCSMHQI